MLSIQKALWNNFQYRHILQELGKGKSAQDYSLHTSSKLFLFQDQVVVPNEPKIQLSILQKHHDFPLAVHPGQEKTLKPVKQNFHWSGMTQFIKDFVSSCQQYASLEVWTPQTSFNSKWSLDLSLNGLYHSTTTVQFF
ncbi:hypothetical protein O181_113627 [Austropuccinia psidii MF-1]|uniref:Integrase zinc-binding domain-containing protein n=1 Tax=Austropuccinia psidii MF-1 TaxID=1389203 RepID=A0A9Q3K430_9BASI|nr:hypothetical protein [Austropuccinia psidii MF-1]